MDFRILVAFPVWTIVCMNIAAQCMQTCANVCKRVQTCANVCKRVQTCATMVPRYLHSTGAPPGAYQRQTHHLQTCHTTVTKFSKFSKFAKFAKFAKFSKFSKLSQLQCEIS